MALNISNPFPVVASIDPAIDTEAMTESEMLAYIHDRDVSTLKFKHGQRPATFMLREISHEALEEILGEPTDAKRFAHAFRAAVIEVTGHRFDDGTRDRLSPANAARGLAVEEAKAFRMSTIIDIGSVAWARSFLGPDTVRRYVPPPLLLAHLAALPYRSADLNDADPSKSKGSATPESAGHVATSNVALSASPTAAPVTAETSHPAA